MKKILIIEDDYNSRYLLRLFLNKKGFSTDEATSVDEALELITCNKYDLFLLDLNLKGDLTSDVLLQENIKPVILTTAYKICETNLNNARYMRKPFDLNKLLEMINELTNT